jgi:hypothetical protein
LESITEDNEYQITCPALRRYRKENFMNKKNCLLVFVTSLVFLSSCTSLKSVHEYGTFIHATVAEVKPVAEDFYTSCMRANTYRGCGDSNDCETEKEASSAIITVAKVLDTYGAALSTLSSDELGNYGAEFKNLTSEVNNIKSEKIDHAKINIIGEGANLIANAATRAYQQKQLTIFISDCNDAVVNVSNTLADLIEKHYSQAIIIEIKEWENSCREAENEKEKNYIEWVAFSKEHWKYRIDLQNKLNAAKNLAKNIRNIGKTHAKLKKDLNNLSGKEVADAVNRFINEARPVIQEIKDSF